MSEINLIRRIRKQIHRRNASLTEEAGHFFDFSEYLTIQFERKRSNFSGKLQLKTASFFMLNCNNAMSDFYLALYILKS